MSKVDTEWFRRRLETIKMSQRKLAKHMGLDPGAVSLMLRGMRKIKLEEATLLAQILTSPTSEVIRAAGVDELEGVRPVPVVGTIGVDSVVSMDLDSTEHQIHGPADLPPGSVAVQFMPGYPGGFLPDAIAFFPKPDGVSQDAVSRLAIVKLVDGPVLCTFLRRGVKTGTYSTEGNIQVAIEWATPVLWIKT